MKPILVAMMLTLSAPVWAVDVSSEWEVIGAVIQDTEADSWRDDYGLGVSINVGWFRGGATLMDDATLSPEAGALLSPQSRTFGYAGIGVASGDIFYRAGVYRKLFVWDETTFTVGAGLRYLDMDAPESDLQPWLSVGWVGR